jgi:DNA-binding NtrC family response regulator
LHALEKEYIKKVLEKTGGNKYQAAHALGIDRKTLYRKLAEMEDRLHSEE